MTTNSKGLIPRIRDFFTFEKGSIKIIFALVLPILCETLLSSLFGMVDHMMAGQHSTHALNAIGLFNSPQALLVVLFTAINTGTTTRVAWNIGAGRIDSARRVMRTSIILNILVGIIVTVIGVFFAEPIIDYMAGGKYGSVYEKGTIAYDGVQVFQICSLGFIFTGVTSAITSTLRGAGENRIPLFYNMLANFLNVIGNYVFIYGVDFLGIPEMAAQGAALSTSISRFLAMAFAIIFLCCSKRSKFALRNKVYATNFSEDGRSRKKLPFFVPDISISKKILAIGVPSMLESVIMQAGMLLFTKLVISTGNDSYAAHQISNSINNMFLMICVSFSSAAGTLVGQNLGAKNIDGAKYYTRTIVKLTVSICCVAAVFIALFAKNLLGLYTDDENVIRIATQIMYVCSFILVTTAFQNCYSGALKGAGDTKFPLYSAIVCTLLVRVVLAYIVVNILNLGIFFVWLATLTDIILRAIIIYIRYRSGRWEKYARKASEE